MKPKGRPGRWLVPPLGLAVGMCGAFVVAHAGRVQHARHRDIASVKRLVLPAPAPGATPGATLAVSVPAEPGSARAAVETFYTAEASDRPQDAFPLLVASAARHYGSAAEWVARQADRLRPVTFVVGGATPVAGRPGEALVTVDATHAARLDPFVGLVPARTHDLVRAIAEGGRWRVDPDVVVDAVYPSDETVDAIVTAWVGDLQACRRGPARALEVDIGLVGSPYYLGRPCTERGRWTVGATRDPSGADIQPLVAAYGPEAAMWARLVPVLGPTTSFYAAVAPLGDAWRVMGVLAGDGQIRG